MLKNVHMDSKADKVNDCPTPLPLSRGELSDSKQMPSIKKNIEVLKYNKYSRTLFYLYNESDSMRECLLLSPAKYIFMNSESEMTGGKRRRHFFC